MSGPRTSRQLAEMIEQLERQLNLLEEYARDAFEERRTEFLPEVAAKLRILLVRSRQNIPLLFRVADALGVVPKVVLDGPPLQPPPGRPGPGDEITLDKFFDLEAVTIRTSAGLVTMTKRELIRAWCEQLGGVHEDWEVEDALINAVHAPFFVNGMQLSALELSNCVRTTIREGRRLLAHAKKRPNT